MVIADFTYDQGAPRSTSAHGVGYSLVLMCPGANKPGLAQSWRTSAIPGGNPGSSDVIDLAAWMAANGVADLTADT